MLRDGRLFPQAREVYAMHMATKMRRWSRADLERLPDDGNRYEVLDGQLFVTPLPLFSAPVDCGTVAGLAGQLCGPAPAWSGGGPGRRCFRRQRAAA